MGDGPSGWSIGRYSAPRPRDFTKEGHKSTSTASGELQRPRRPDILAKVLTTYLNDSRILVEEMRAAVEARDPGTLAKTAHRLKSSSAAGVLATAAHCKELGQLGHVACLNDAAQLLAQCAETHQAARSTIAAELRRHTPS